MSAAPEFALEARSLVQAFRSGFWLRERTVLHGVELALRPGEFVGLAGPNGSGKSSLLRILAAVDQPKSGSVRVHGQDSSTRAARQQLGFVPEDCPSPPELTGRDALELCGALHRLARRERRTRAEHWLERVGLRDASQRKLGAYSRGMRRRLGLAAALLHEPSVLLFDEPTAGLDAQGFEVFESVLGEARARGTTLLVCSHVLTDLQRNCDRLAVLLDGRIAALGPPLELIAKLGPRARVAATIEGADPATLRALEATANAGGARWLGVEPAQANLSELYASLRKGRA
jgi:ABC-2 type transport system ATP-binding protein